MKNKRSKLFKNHLNYNNERNTSPAYFPLSGKFEIRSP